MSRLSGRMGSLFTSPAAAQGRREPLFAALATNRVLHENVVILSVKHGAAAACAGQSACACAVAGSRYLSGHGADGVHGDPDVPHLLKSAQGSLPFDVDEAVYFMGQDTLVVANPRGMHPWRKRLFVVVGAEFAVRGVDFRDSAFRAGRAGWDGGDLRGPQSPGGWESVTERLSGNRSPAARRLRLLRLREALQS